jgi:hypothetical protein
MTLCDTVMCRDLLLALCFDRGAGVVMDSTEYAVTCLHLLVNVGLSCRDLFVTLRRLGTSDALAQRLLQALDALRGNGTRACARAD